jgi:hypothetical protein
MATVRHLGLFPWCVYDPEIQGENDFTEGVSGYGPSKFFSMGWTLQEAMQVLWRVKSWSVETSESLYPGILQPGFINGTTPYPTSVTGPLTEKDLPCKILTSGFGALTFFDALNPAPDENPYEVLVLLEMISAGAPYDTVKRGDLYYLPIFVGLDGAFATRYERGSGLSWSAKIDIDSVPPSVYNFAPLEYWPYDPEDGLGPIYDSATGAQLRDFPAS